MRLNTNREKHRKNMKILRTKTTAFFAVGICIFLLALSSSSVFAVSAEYTQPYSSDVELSFGSLVSLKDTSGDIVEPTTIANARKFLGVYVEDEGATVAITRSGGDKQIAVSGSTVALVSTISGDIREGDLLAPSLITGVASKFDKDNSVIGVALSDFDVNNPKNSNVEVTLIDGGKKNTVIGPLVIELFAIKNGVQPKPDLIGWVERISGKPVSTFKIVSALVLTVLLLGSVTIMAYSAIRNTIVQSSRNPLAKPVIMRTLLRVFIIIVGITLAGIVIIYAVLRA